MESAAAADAITARGGLPPDCPICIDALVPDAEDAAAAAGRTCDHSCGGGACGGECDAASATIGARAAESASAALEGLAAEESTGLAAAAAAAATAGAPGTLRKTSSVSGGAAIGSGGGGAAATAAAVASPRSAWRLPRGPAAGGVADGRAPAPAAATATTGAAAALDPDRPCCSRDLDAPPPPPAPAAPPHDKAARVSLADLGPDLAVATPCGHVFHSLCLIQYERHFCVATGARPVCPVCRAQYHKILGGSVCAAAPLVPDESACPERCTPSEAASVDAMRAAPTSDGVAARVGALVLA